MFDSDRARVGGCEQRLDPAGASDLEVAERVAAIERQRTRLDAESAVLLGELEARKVTDREFGLGTAAWLAHEAGLPSGVARNRVRVAWKLRRYLPLVADALESGRIGWEHVRTIVELANPRIIDTVVANQELLIGLAERCRFEPWRGEVRSLARLWDQDGGYDPNEDPNANRLSYGTTLDGLLTLAATLTGEHAEVVAQAIETKTDELHRRALRDHEACEEIEVPSRSTLRALALTELIRQALGIDLESSRGPKVEATMVVDADDPTVATNPDGVRLADGTTRVLRCDAEIHALVVDRLGVPLDLGRHVRWASDGQRRAVRHRDGGCVFAGCGAKVMWCDVHHCVHAEHGGVTDVCNLVCLCRHHHEVVHRTGWSVRVDHDGWAIFRTPNGNVIWGQRHGRQRAGPPPDPLHEPTATATHAHRHPPGGTHTIAGRSGRAAERSGGVGREGVHGLATGGSDDAGPASGADEVVDGAVPSDERSSTASWSGSAAAVPIIS